MKAKKELRYAGRHYRATLENEATLTGAIEKMMGTAFAQYCAKVVGGVDEPAHVPYLTAGRGSRDQTQKEFCGLRAFACGDYPFGPGGIIGACYDGCELCS